MSNPLVRSYRIGRKAFITLAGLWVGRVNELAPQVSEAREPAAPFSRITAFRISRREQKQSALPVSTLMQELRAEGATILEQIGWAAEQGTVPDGMPRRLRANLEAELTEHRRLLTEDQHAVQAGVRHLAALFPLPPAPEPELPAPPAPPRRKNFPPLGDLLAQRPKGRLN